MNGDSKISDAIQTLVKHLQVGRLPTRSLLSYLASQGFRLIVSLVEEWELHPFYKDYDEYEKEAFKRGMQLIRLETPEASPPDIDEVLKIYRLMDVIIGSGGKVYIHCFMGAGRSPTFAVGYLIYKSIPLEKAKIVVNLFSAKFKPTREQLSFLKYLEKTLMKERDHYTK